jgi:hypothetical protein
MEKKFWSWVGRHVDPRFIFTPIGKVNRVYHTRINSIIGFSDYYIFGIRIARIQQTKPWC